MSRWHTVDRIKKGNKGTITKGNKGKRKEISKYQLYGKSI